MNSELSRIGTYLKLILLILVLGSVLLYLAGAPIADYLISKGNMLIIDGAPGDLGNLAPQLSKLELNQNSTTDLSEIRVPELNTKYGTIICDRIALSAPVYYGDNDSTLQQGVGQFPNGNLPGLGKPLLMSAHDMTWFAPLADIRIGDVVTINTDYGQYSYTVISKIIAEADDTTAYDLTKDQEQLILYTCYPFGQTSGNRSKRFFVYCSPVIDQETE